MLGSSAYTCLAVGLRVGLVELERGARAYKAGPGSPQAPGVMTTECGVLEACLLKDC